MKPISRIASAVRASTTLAVDNLAKSMKAEGIDVIGFGAGEPDFDTPEHIKQAGLAAISANQTRYTPSSGTVALRKGICERIKADTGVEYEPSQIVVSSGAKHCIYAALSVLLNPGDEVILPAPYWVSYYEEILMCGGVPVIVNTTEDEGYRLPPERLEAAITDKTKCVIINNPSNPTGMMYTRDELKTFADICVKNDIYIISDEIYCSLVYDDNKFTSMASLGDEIREHTILINGVSKTYAMTGWRIGYLAANKEIAGVMANFLSHSTGNPCSVAQAAALEALTGPQDQVEVMRREFEKRREYILSRIETIEGLSCHKPEGAFYVMLNISHYLGRRSGDVVLNDADDFSSELLKKGLVAVVSGVGFGAPEYVRWSYATSRENICKGFDRLEKFLAELK